MTFDATLTVTGSGALTQASGGLGVIGDGSNLVSNGESLSFGFSVGNFVGGTVIFDGFTAIDFNYFITPDAGVLSIDSLESSTADNFFTTIVGADVVDFSATSPSSFYAIASSGALNSFRVDDVSASFIGTVTPVPEPSNLLIASVALFSAATFNRRRPRRH